MAVEKEDIQSKGGKTRAEKLSPEDRSTIASVAAEARWSKSGKERAPHVPKADFGSPDRPLRIGDLEIPCYVLDDGRSVVTQGGMLAALKMSQGTATKGGGDRLANFASTKSINPFISDRLREMITQPIRFKSKGQLAY